MLPITQRNGQTKESVLFTPKRPQHYASKKLRKALEHMDDRPKTINELKSLTGYKRKLLYQYLEHFYIRQSFDTSLGQHTFQIHRMVGERLTLTRITV